MAVHQVVRDTVTCLSYQEGPSQPPGSDLTVSTMTTPPHALLALSHTLSECLCGPHGHMLTCTSKGLQIFPYLYQRY